jgi:DNA-binding NtrC family response regulator
MSADRATVLFVDDEERILRSLRMLFRSQHNVLVATSGRQALTLVRNQPVHVVVSDQRMPEITGVELLHEVRAISPATMRLLLTGYSDLPSIVGSVNDGEIFRFIEKPWQAQYLTDVVAEAASIALRLFASDPLEVLRAANAPATGGGLKLLVLDEDSETFQLVRQLIGPQHHVQHVNDVEGALAALSDHDVAVVVAELRNRNDDVAGALKTLKRYNPGTLTIAVSQMRDARALIDLINQGQVYRFLPKPLSRELMRRSLQSAIDHHGRTRAAPILLRRNTVEEPKFEPTSLSAKLMDYWRRIRENNRARANG